MRVLGPDVVDEMVAQTLRTVISCTTCGNQFSFEEGERLAMCCGVDATLAVCPQCGSIFEADAAPRRAVNRPVGAISR